MKLSLIFLTIFIVLFNVAKCSKILILGTMASHSHFTLTFKLAKVLAEKNHQVTFVNPYPQKTPIKNIRDVSIAEVNDFLNERRKNLFQLDKSGAVVNQNEVFELGLIITQMVLENKNVQNLRESGEQFDLVLIEHFLNDALIGFGQQFNAPVILLIPFSSSIMSNYLVANPSPSSYVANVVGSFTSHMNFWERIQNLAMNTLFEASRERSFLPAQREIYRKHFKGLELDDVLYNVSLMLTNSHVSVTDAIPHHPNVIEIGGYHVSPPKKLPADLQKYLDDAKDGVILFSMGSNLKSKDLLPQTRKSLLKAFSKIKQQVLWKFETDLEEKPANVKIMKWLPQGDILAHPNVRAFISHGGLLSTIETVYHGVPVIGIPVFGDQKGNIARAVDNGYAVSVPLSEITEETFTNALNEIINNPRYRENVRQRSKLMHDQPLKPIDSAVYWIEHVIRHRGAPHLRSSAVDLKWYQRDMLDIALFFHVIALLIFIIVKKVAAKICAMFCSKKIAAKTSANKKKQ